MKRTVLFLMIGVTGLLLIVFYLTVGEKEIRIAFVGRFTETTSIADIDAYRTTEYAIGKMNKEENKYILIRYDLSDFDEPNHLMEHIHEDRIDIVLGPSTSSEVVPLIKYYNELDIAVFPIASSSDTLTNIDDNIFRLTNPISSQVDFYSEYISRKDYHHIMMFYDENNLSYSSAYEEVMRNALEGYDIKVESLLVGDLNEEEVLNSIDFFFEEHSGHFDGIFLVVGPGKAGLLSQYLSEKNDTIDIYHTSWSNSDSTLEYVADIENDIYTTTLAEPTYQEVFDVFKRKLNDEVNVNYSAFAYFGYEMPYFVDYIIDSTGTPKLAQVKSFVHRLELYTGQFADYEFNDYGDGMRGFEIQKVADGTYVTIK